MLSRSLLLVIVCHQVFAAEVARAEVPAATPGVEIPIRLVQLAQTQTIGLNCGRAYASAYACTQFVDEGVTATCSAREGLWKMRLTMQVTARLIVVDRFYIRHELNHVNDIRAALSRYGSEYEAYVYESANACEAAARLATGRFRPYLQSVAAASNELRH